MSTRAAFTLAVGSFIVWFVSSGRANAFFSALKGPASQTGGSGGGGGGAS